MPLGVRPTLSSDTSSFWLGTTRTLPRFSGPQHPGAEGAPAELFGTEFPRNLPLQFRYDSRVLTEPLLHVPLRRRVMTLTLSSIAGLTAAVLFVVSWFLPWTHEVPVQTSQSPGTGFAFALKVVGHPSFYVSPFWIILGMLFLAGVLSLWSESRSGIVMGLLASALFALIVVGTDGGVGRFGGAVPAPAAGNYRWVEQLMPGGWVAYIAVFTLLAAALVHLAFRSWRGVSSLQSEST